MDNSDDLYESLREHRGDFDKIQEESDVSFFNWFYGF